MSTCKDCINFADCLNYESTPYYGLDACCNNVEERCEDFKNKADYVEVVRCKNCKYLTVHNSPTLYAYCKKEHIRFEPFQKDTRTHFCSYGERK